MTGTVELADRAQLATWLDGVGLSPGAEVEVEALGGGSSNAMFVVRRGGQEWILRRPAAVAVERANEGMRREFRILSALAGTGVPHPRAVALCEDHTVLGATFYLMERVDGFNPVPSMLPETFDQPEGRRAVTNALTDALASLHEVDWRGAGLEDIDRSAGFHERQVTRWLTQLDSYGERQLPGVDDLAAWLGDHRPDRFEPTLMHGDFHMLNVLVAPTAPARVAAILDWETATIGDPLLDLAGFCEIWTPLTDPASGWPTKSDIVARYAERRAIELPSLRYYELLYNFRMTVLAEGIYQRSLQDRTRQPMEALRQQATRSLSRARELLEQAPSDRS